MDSYPGDLHAALISPILNDRDEPFIVRGRGTEDDDRDGSTLAEYLKFKSLFERH